MNTVDASRLLEAAWGYCAEGMYLLPLRGKTPLLSDWPDRASNNCEVVEGWLSIPDVTGLGIATGRSKLLVVDVDAPKQHDVLRRWVDGRGLPTTRSQLTGRDGGGAHHIFGCHTPVRNRSFRDAHIDIRGWRGQIVAAPSPHPQTGRPYTMDDAPIVPAPEWLIELAGLATSADVAPASVQRLLLTEAGGDRSRALFRIYARLLPLGWSDEQVVKLILPTPVGSKAAAKSSPEKWLLDDIERFRADSWSKNHDEAAEIQRRLEGSAPQRDLLSSSPRKVLTVLHRHAVHRGSVKVTASIDQLAVDSSCSSDTCRRALRKLERAGLVNLVSQGGGCKASVWEVTDGSSVVEGDGEVEPANAMKDYCAPAGPTSVVTDTKLEPQVVGSLETGAHAEDNLATPTPTQHKRVVVGVAGLAKLDPGADESRYRALGACYRYLDALAQPRSETELASMLGASGRSVRRNLSRLRHWGLAEPHNGDWRTTPQWQQAAGALAGRTGQRGRRARQQLEVDNYQEARKRRQDAWAVEIPESVRILRREAIMKAKAEVAAQPPLIDLDPPMESLKGGPYATTPALDLDDEAWFQTGLTR